MKNATNQNYGYGGPNFQQKPETADFEIILSIGNNEYAFLQDEFSNDSPSRHPEQDRNPEYPLPYDFDQDEETDLDDVENDDDEENDEDDFHPRKNLFDQDLLNPFTTDAGL